jgi:hypothetical protein
VLCDIVNHFSSSEEVTSDGLFSVGEMECMVTLYSLFYRFIICYSYSDAHNSVLIEF